MTISSEDLLAIVKERGSYRVDKFNKSSRDIRKKLHALCVAGLLVKYHEDMDSYWYKLR